MTKLVVEVWSDIACPWCYVGKRRLEIALESFPHAEDVEVVFRSFELDPSAPRVRSPEPYVDRLARKYGRTAAQTAGMVQRLVDVARADGLEMDFDGIQPGNTFDAHRLLHAAEPHGLASALTERLFRAYFAEGQAVGEPNVLRRLAREVGLDADEVESVLSSDAYASDVRDDQDEARALGVGGVPFFVFDRRLAVSGAQPVELLLGALHKAWESRPIGLEDEGDSEGTVCGPDGCA